MVVYHSDYSKKKISVITLHSSINYGSVLQTYATNVVFNALDCDIEFVDYTRYNSTFQSYAKRMQQHKPIKIIKRLTLGVFNRLIDFVALKRVENRARPMRVFLEQYVNFTPEKYWSFEEIKKKPPIADVYCTGSDQVWNSIWNDGIELPYFLEYVPEGKKRIAYAASIGRESIDDIEKNEIREYLQKYSHISMREQSGVDLLRSMEIEATWVVDPTLMLTKNEWMKVADPIKMPNKRFLLAYVLNWNDKIADYAKQIAEENDLVIIRILKSKAGRLSRSRVKNIVPESVGQLLSYFNQASYVITDSFHGTAFSLNFHKKFVVIPPERFSTRINSLLSLTGTEERMIQEDNRRVKITDSIDWSRIDAILENERKKAFTFLRKAIYE